MNLGLLSKSMGHSRQNLRSKRASFAEFQLLKKRLDEATAENRLDVIEVTVTGESMMPWLRPGENLLVRGFTLEKLKIFDPIVFWSGKEAVCHLYLRKNQFRTTDGEEAVLTHGLNNKEEDLIVPVSRILGVVIKPKPWWLGFFLWWRRWKK